ncbi:serine hydrolase domain-containing protein [Actinopolyspora mortivallis]|uniref:Hydrolase n=1 Tax=Actinopolyspora mortivallis TaxID=33906 RepID=A0A2T0H1E7_ACTMO|nr:serine hydrolase domain-containing protein [Actinopolyspora mortivallis]PRW65195.1 hydrolase [Actinopolyspora mortivallis]
MRGFHRTWRGLVALAVVTLLGLTGPFGAAGATPPGERETDHSPNLGEQLRRRLDAVHEAGMPGVQAAVRHGSRSAAEAAGVADTRTGRPLRAGFHHRVASVTKTFVATAVLRQVERGNVELDAPVGRYLPELVPGERGQRVTVRMLLNHTSGIADYVRVIFGSFYENSPRDLDRNRFHYRTPGELIRMGLDQPPTNEPGARWSYSNTNYVLAGELLRKVTGQSPQRYVTREIIRPLGLHDTYFPGANPVIAGPHSKAYEALHHVPERRGEYSVYNMTWAGTAGALISTPEELNRFYRALLGGRLLKEDTLAEMRRTVAVPDVPTLRYGLGLMRVEAGDCGPLWGHDGQTWGMVTLSLHSADGTDQLSYGVNLTDYQRLDEDGQPLPHPIDRELGALQNEALCGGDSTKVTTPEPLAPTPARVR